MGSFILCHSDVQPRWDFYTLQLIKCSSADEPTQTHTFLRRGPRGGGLHWLPSFYWLFFIFNISILISTATNSPAISQQQVLRLVVETIVGLNDINDDDIIILEVAPQSGHLQEGRVTLEGGLMSSSIGNAFRWIWKYIQKELVFPSVRMNVWETLSCYGHKQKFWMLRAQT